ncbi:Uncharacterised protein [uncultured archaeon]|nr:Uncharacterised protein [uncultured archaeon]
MKIRALIQEYIPCEVCGNDEFSKFGFHVIAHWGNQPYVKCCNCGEEYYSTTARATITRAEDARKGKKTMSGFGLPKKCRHGAYEKTEEKKDYASIEPMSRNSTNIDLPEIHKRYNTPFLRTIRSLCD